MVHPAIDIEQLTVGERLELIEQLWDSLRRGTGVRPLSDAEREVIEARRAEPRTDTAGAIGWESVRVELVADRETDDPRARSST
jgi:putative addiction module component (TIGR02574 family)